MTTSAPTAQLDAATIGRVLAAITTLADEMTTGIPIVESGSGDQIVYAGVPQTEEGFPTQGMDCAAVDALAAAFALTGHLQAARLAIAAHSDADTAESDRHRFDSDDTAGFWRGRLAAADRYLIEVGLMPHPEATDQPIAAPQGWTRETAAAYVAQLDSTARGYLADAIRDHDAADHLGQAVDAIRVELAAYVAKENGPGEGADPTRDIIGVIFRPVSFDNGYFLGPRADVMYVDGTVDELDITEAAEAFTKLYGSVGQDAGFAYSTHTGETEFDESAAEWNLVGWLRVEADRAAGRARQA